MRTRRAYGTAHVVFTCLTISGILSCWILVMLGFKTTNEYQLRHMWVGYALTLVSCLSFGIADWMIGRFVGTKRGK